MKDRVVSTNPRRYELVSQAGTGVNGGALYDVYFASTPDVVGTPLKASVVLSDAVGNQFGLNAAQTDYTQTDFPSPNNAFRDVWKFLYPIGAIFEWIPIGGSSVDLSTPALVAAHFGGGTWARWGEGTFSAGYKLGDTDFGIVGATGGYKGIQKHTHTVNHGHTVETSGALTADLNTVGLSTSTIADHLHTISAHTHTASSTTVSVNSETEHTHGAGSLATGSAGTHDHNAEYNTYTTPSGSTHAIRGLVTGGGEIDAITSAGSHTHAITGTTTDGTTHTHTTDSHTHTIASGGGGNSSNAGGHLHTISAHQHNIPTHTHTISSSNYTTAENTTDGAIALATNGNLPPFTVSYKYVRTA